MIVEPKRPRDAFQNCAAIPRRRFNKKFAAHWRERPQPPRRQQRDEPAALSRAESSARQARECEAFGHQSGSDRSLLTTCLSASMELKLRADVRL